MKAFLSQIIKTSLPITAPKRTIMKKATIFLCLFLSLSLSWAQDKTSIKDQLESQDEYLIRNLLMQKVVAEDGAEGDKFGKSLAIDGDYAIVGARFDSDKGSSSGSAYIYELDGSGNWSEKKKLLASDGSASDEFGNSVSIDGNYAIVGAYYDDDKGSASGSAYIFERNAEGTWSDKHKLIASDGAAIDYFGISVAINGNSVIVGAYLDDDKGAGSGSAYFYNLSQSSTPTATLFNTPENASSYLVFQIQKSPDAVSGLQSMGEVKTAIQFKAFALLQDPADLNNFVSVPAAPSAIALSNEDAFVINGNGCYYYVVEIGDGTTGLKSTFLNKIAEYNFRFNSTDLILDEAALQIDYAGLNQTYNPLMDVYLTSTIPVPEAGPAITITKNPVGWSTSYVSVTASAVAATSVSYRTKTVLGDWSVPVLCQKSSSSSINTFLSEPVVITSNGTQIEFTAINANNASSIAAQTIINIDNFALITSGLAYDIVKQTPTDRIDLSIECFDQEIIGSSAASGIKTSELAYQIDSGALHYIVPSAGKTLLGYLFTFSIDMPITPTDPTITVYVYDIAGNITEASVIIVKDNQPPTYTLSADSFAHKIGSNYVLRSVFSDLTDNTSGVNESACFYAIDGGTKIPLVFVQETEKTAYPIVSAYSEGTHSILFTISDNVGNEATSSVTFQIDKTSPTIDTNLYTAENSLNGYIKKNITLTGSDALSGLDASTWAYKLGSGDWINSAITDFTQDGSIVIRVSDNAGNTTEVNGPFIQLDTVGPVITTTEIKTPNSITLQAAAVDNECGEILTSTWQHRQGTGAWENGSQLTITGAGTYSIEWKVSDFFGNENTSAYSCVFFEDYILPVIDTIAIVNADYADSQDGSEIIYDFQKNTNLKVIVTASDKIDASTAGSIKEYKYRICDESGFLTFQEIIQAGSELNIQEILNALLVIHPNTDQFFVEVQAVDQSGNASAWFGTSVRIDTSAPLAPVITSNTHPQADAINDTVSNPTAVFQILSGVSGSSGIHHYHYTLSTILNGVIQETLVNADTVAPLISFPNLSDNLENQYYALHVTSFSGAGLSTNSSEYRFRIDTTPPETLTISSQTHNVDGLFYNTPNAIFQWNRPKDLSGIKTFYYKYAQTPILSDGFSYADIDATWTATQNLQLPVHLPTCFNLTHGDFYLAVIAVDVVNKIQTDQVGFHYDFENPSLNASDLAITPLPLDHGLEFNWINASDASGISNYEIRVASYNNSELEYLMPWASLGSSALTYSLKNLDDEVGNIAVVFLKVTDVAGNTITLAKAYEFGTGVVDVILAIPYENVAGGFTVTGLFSTDASQREAALQVPAGINFLQNAQRLDLIPLGDLIFADEEEGGFVSGSNPDVSFVFSYNGFTMNITGLSLSTVTGLTFNLMTYDMTDSTNTVRHFSYANVPFNGLPYLNFAPFSAPVAEPFDLTTQIPGNPVSQPSWKFLQIGGTGWSGPSWQITDSALLTSDIIDYVQIYRLNAQDERQYQLDNVSAGLNIHQTAVSGLIAEDFFIEKTDYKFLVHSALIGPDYLELLDAELIINNGMANAPVKMGGLKVYRNGAIEATEGFHFTAFTLYDNLGVYSVSGLEWNNGILVITVAHPIINGILSTTPIDGDIYLNSVGLEFPAGTTIPTQDLSLFGFIVTSDGFQTQPGSGVLLKNAILHLGENFNNTNIPLDNLVVSLGAIPAVLSEGLSANTLTLNIVSPYGTNSVTQLALTPTGLVARSMDIPMPYRFSSTTNKITIKDTVLHSAGTLSASPDTNTFASSFGIFELDVQKARYDGSQLDLVAFILKNSHISADLSVFHNWTLTRTQTLQSGIADTAAPFWSSFNGWMALLKNCSINSSGISSVNGELHLSMDLGGGIVNFAGYGVSYDGNAVITGLPDPISLSVKDWDVTASLPVISGEELSLSDVKVHLYLQMTDQPLSLSALTVNSYGSVIECAQGNEAVLVEGTNGYKAEFSGYAFDEEGLKYGGKIFFPTKLGSSNFVAIAPMSLYMGRDGLIETARLSINANFTLADWTVTAQEFEFSYNSLIVYESTITLPLVNTVYTLPRLDFEVDGAIFEDVSIYEPQLWEFDQLKLSVSAITFGEKGLMLSAFVGLPPDLGVSEIYFDVVRLNPNGTLYSETIVPQFKFHIEDVYFELYGLQFNNNGIYLDNMVVTLPQCMGYKQLKISSSRIGFDGQFDIGRISFDPVEFKGFTFYFDGLSLNNEGLKFEGRVRLPGNLPAQLGNKIVAIKTFEVSFTQGVTAFDVMIDGTFPFDLAPGWTLSVTGIGISKNQDDYLIYVNEASLTIPPEYHATSASISGITFNPLTGEASFGEITVNGAYFDIASAHFTFSTLSVANDPNSDNFILTLAGSVSISGERPAFIPETINFNDLVVSTDGTLSSCNISVPLNNAPLGDALIIKNGTLGFHYNKAADILAFDLNGQVWFGPGFPADLQDDYLTIQKFAFDINQMKITELSFISTELEFMLFDDIEVTKARFSMNIDTYPVLTLGVIATAKLPVTYPGVLAGAQITVNPFIFKTNGEIVDFNGSLYIAEEKTLLGEIKIKESTITADYVDTDGSINFGMTGTVFLSQNVPEDLKGITFNIHEITYNTTKGLDKLDITGSIGKRKLFNLLDTDGLTVNVVKDPDGIFVFSLSGIIRLPMELPEGLAGLPVNIETFQIGTDGVIRKLSVVANDINTDIYDILKLSNVDVGLKYVQAQDDYVLNITGTLELPEEMKIKFGDVALDITRLEVSSRNGLVAFNTQLRSPVPIEPIPSVHITIQQLNVSNTGFGLAASFNLPASLPEGLAGKPVLAQIAMGWDGELISLSGSLASAQVTIAGFTANLTGLVFTKDGIGVASCSLTLPPALGGSVGVTNAGFNWSDGSFYGTPDFSGMNLDFAGFQLVVKNPQIDFDALCISFESVYCKLPDMVGGQEIQVNGLVISKDGIKLTGGRIALPNFTVCGNLGFRDIYVEFAFGENNSYIVTGNGVALIPGFGEIGANVKFINKSTLYPWGLKSATFWFQLDPGIPLGATGMYLNYIEGGIEFGNAESLPSQIKGYFTGTGVKLRLGIGVKSVYATGKATVWIDVSNGDFAFKGNMSILSGAFSADLLVALTKQGFYGNLKIQLVFVRGELTVYIFQANGRQRFSGEGYLVFTIPYNLISFKIWVPFRTIRINLPGFSWDTPKLQTEFGNFKKDGRDVNGFKAFVSIPILGSTGIFFSTSGSITLGSVSSYTLYKPSFVKSATLGPKSQSTSVFESEQVLNSEVEVLDKNKGNKEKQSTQYAFDVPKSGNTASATPFVGKPAETKSVYLNDFRSMTKGSTASQYVEKTDRIMFVMAVAEGDPVMVAIAPDGTEYREGDAKVEMFRQDHGYIMIIHDPMEGTWNLNVENYLNETDFEVAVFGVDAIPEMVLSTPSVSGQRISNTFTVKGQLKNTANPVRTIQIGLSSEAGVYGGTLVAEVISDANGYFEAQVDAAVLMDGLYHVWAKTIEEGIDPSIKAEAKGTLDVKASQSLKAVTDFVVGNEDNKIKISFSDDNGERSRGFNLYIKNITSGEIEKIDLGFVTATSVSNIGADGSYQIWIKAYDVNQKEGLISNVISLNTQAAKPSINQLSDASSISVTTLEAGATVSGVLNVPVQSFTASNSAMDWFRISIKTTLIEDPENPQASIIGPIEGSSAQMIQKVQNSGIAFPVELTAAWDTLPGTYNIYMTVTCLGDETNTKTYNVGFSVVYGTTTITSVTPNAWNQNEAPTIVLEGNNFYPGTKIMLGTSELAVSKFSKTSMEIAIPADISAEYPALTLVTPDAKIVPISVHVIQPDTVLVGFKTQATVRPGTTERLFFTVYGIDDFTGDRRFTLTNVPSDLNASLESSNISSEETGIINIFVPAGTTEGTRTFTLVDEFGRRMEMTVLVTNQEDTPVIASLSDYSVKKGESTWIYGQGFGTNPIVLLGSTALTILSAQDDRIKVAFDGNCVSGDLIVTAAGKTSNSHYVFVKTNGFTVYPDTTAVKLKNGETSSVNVFLAGTQQTVSASVISASPELHVSLDKSSLILNGSVKATVSCEDNTPNGNYSFTLRFLGDDTNSVPVSFNVTVSGQFAFVTSDLPEAMTGLAWNYQLKTENAEGDVNYELVLDENSLGLPAGLKLTSTGLITGTPITEETAIFTVRATDSEGREIQKIFSLFVRADGWMTGEKDFGRTNAVNTTLPSASDVAWQTEIGSPVLDLVENGSLIFASTASDVHAVLKSNGKIQWSLGYPVQEMASAAGILFVRTSTGALEAIHAESGLKIYSRGDLGKLLVHNGKLYIIGTQGLSVIDPATGTLSDRFEAATPNGEVLSNQKNLMIVSPSGIYAFDGTAWIRLKMLDGTSIADLALSDSRLYILDSDGTLTAYDLFGVLKNEIQTDINNGKLSVNATITAVLGDNTLTLIDNNTFTKTISVPVTVENAIVANGSALVDGANGMAVLNLTNGSAIWSDTRNNTIVMISGAKIYHAIDGGILLCNSASGNSNAPVLSFNVTGTEGENSWYTSEADVQISASDKETFVTSLLTRLDGTEFTAATTYHLTEGKHIIEAYATDSNGLVSEIASLEINIDLSKPITDLQLDGIIGENLWYRDSVNFRAIGNDDLSGIDFIAVTDETGESYLATDSLLTEGIHTLSYQATDKAGNTEDVQTKEIKIDKTAPVVNAQVIIINGTAVVTLTSTDILSGTKAIFARKSTTDEFTIVTGALTITVPGRYEVEYFATDFAGNQNAVNRVLVILDAPNNEDLISKVYVDSKNNDFVLDYDTQIGDRLFEPSNGKHNVIANLPVNLTGKLSIRTQFNLGNKKGAGFISFEAMTDIDVYVFKHKNSQADFSSWTLVKTAYPLQDHTYFEGGATLYTKRFDKGQAVLIPGPDIKGSGFGNFVMVRAAEGERVVQIPALDGTSLVSGQILNLHSASTMNDPASVSWDYKIDSGNWVSIGAGQDINWIVPTMSEVSKVRVRVAYTDNKGVRYSSAGVGVILPDETARACDILGYSVNGVLQFKDITNKVDLAFPEKQKDQKHHDDKTWFTIQNDDYKAVEVRIEATVTHNKMRGKHFVAAGKCHTIRPELEVGDQVIFTITARIHNGRVNIECPKGLTIDRLEFTLVERSFDGMDWRYKYKKGN